MKKHMYAHVLNIEELLGSMVSKHSVISYSTQWNHYIKYAQTLDRAMKATTLIEWRQHLVSNTKYAAATINLSLRAIKCIARELHARRQISREDYWDIKEVRVLPPNALLERRRPNNRVRIEPEQMRALCKAPKVSEENVIALRDRALMMTLATSGCRVSEALAIKYRDIVTLPGNHYAIANIMGKRQSEPRTAPLSAEAYSAIMDWLAFRPISSPYIFTNLWYKRDGEMFYSDEPMCPSSATRNVKVYGEQVGLQNIKAHDFRRFVGTQLAAKDIRVAQKVLGHANIATTAKYYIMDNVEAGVTDSLF